MLSKLHNRAKGMCRVFFTVSATVTTVTCRFNDNFFITVITVITTVTM